MSTRASALGGGGDRRLMDSIYRRQRHIYDFSRKYCLSARPTHRRAESSQWQPGVGNRCGTGRNLIAAARAWPRARFCGLLDISAEMLKTARASLARHRLSDMVDIAEADAVSFDRRACSPPRCSAASISPTRCR